MGASNTVVAGDYKGRPVQNYGKLYISLSFSKTLDISKQTVEEYEVLDGSEKTSGTSAVGRAAVGAFFLGPIGLAAGLSAKKKGTYNIAIQFKDGKKSLLEVDEKIYKAIMQVLF